MIESNSRLIAEIRSFCGGQCTALLEPVATDRVDMSAVDDRT